MKSIKINIAAAVCLILGLAIFVTGFEMLDLDIKKLTTESPYVSNSFISSKTIHTISVDDSDTDIKVSPSPDDKIHITYYENDRRLYDISESSAGDLTVIKKNTRKWFDFIDIQLEKPALSVEVPANNNNNIKIKTSDANISIENIHANDVALTSSNNKIQVNNVSASGQFDVNDSDGEILINDTEIEGDIYCHTSNRKLNLNAVAGKNIKTENSDGEVILKSVTSNGSIFTKTSNRDIRLDIVKFNQELNCKDSDGDVKGSIYGKLADYSVTTKTSDGKSNLPENMNGGDKIINIKTANGDIGIDFIN